MKSPANWRTISVGQFVGLINGFAFPSEGFGDNGGMPLIRIRDLRRRETEVNYCGRYDPRYLVKRGDLLIGMDGDFNTVKWQGRDALLNQRVCKLVSRKPDELDQDFLFYRLIDEITRINRITAATTVKHLSSGDVLGIRFDLPPKADQSKIAEILSTVDRTIEQTEALIAKQQRIKTGLMQDLLTRGIDEHGSLRSEQTHKFRDSTLGRIPLEWDVAPIGKYGSRTRPYLRTGPFGSDLNTKHWVEYGVPVLTIGSLGEGDVLHNELLFVSQRTAENLKGFRVVPGDIVFSRVADIGRSLVIQPSHEGWVISSNLMRISLDESRARPSFLYRNIAFSSAVRAQLRTKSNSGGRELVNGPILRALLFPWPSVEEQDQINHRLDSIEAPIRHSVESLLKWQLTKTGLMHDLLTGDRRVTALLDKPEVGSA